MSSSRIRSARFVPSLTSLESREVPAAVIREATGTSIADILGERDAFRVDLGGGTTSGSDGSFGGVRREINWDLVPNDSSTPTILDNRFFADRSERGLVMSSPATGFQVSARASQGIATNFGNVDPSYSNLFAPFSEERIFAAVGQLVNPVPGLPIPTGSVTTSYTFEVPGQKGVKGTVTGFGVVFLDVNIEGPTRLQLFDERDNLIFDRAVLATAGSKTYSFLGVSFPESDNVRISRAQIIAGTLPMGPGVTQSMIPNGDIVALDDFLYSEPQVTVLPQVTPPPGIFVTEGVPTSFPMGSFTDPNNSGNYTIRVNWGDDTPDTIFLQASPGDIPAQMHTYTQPGSFLATIIVQDADGTSKTAAFSVTVSNKADWFAVGSPDGNKFQLRSGSGSLLRESEAFESGVTSGVRVACADFNGDGVLDTVVATGPGVPGRVRVLNGVDNSELFSTQPFEASFTGGLWVAAGDINRDCIPELVITPDVGGGPRVKVYDGSTFTLLADFFGIDDANFRGGARVAMGDMNDDGYADLAVAAGVGGGPRVTGYDGKTLTSDARKVLFNRFLFEEALRNGVYIAVGDTNGDGYADLAVGGGPGGGPRIRILSGQDLSNPDSFTETTIGNFFAGDPNDRNGVRVSIADLDDDERMDVLAGVGSRVIGYQGTQIFAEGDPIPFFSEEAFPGSRGGVYVGGAPTEPAAFPRGPFLPGR